MTLDAGTDSNRAATLFEFDDGASWLPILAASLGALLPRNARDLISSTQPDGPWSASETLSKAVDIDAVYEAMRRWVSERDVAAYHGTRLNPVQRGSVARNGLRRLVPADRSTAIEAFLGEHPRWDEIRHRVPEALAFMERGGAGNRAGQVHLTLSREGLVKGFNHYLVEGSEFDHHVANYLLGEECHEQNRRRGEAILYRVRLSGEEALAAANLFGEMKHPNLLREVFQSVSWFLSTGDTETSALELDCGMILYRDVEPADIIETITIPDSELWEHYDHRLR